MGKKPNAANITRGLAQLGGGAKKDGGGGMLQGMENLYNAGYKEGVQQTLANIQPSIEEPALLSIDDGCNSVYTDAIDNEDDAAVEIGAALLLLGAGLVIANAPEIKRFWNEKAVPKIKRMWSKISGKEEFNRRLDKIIDQSIEKHLESKDD